MLDEDLWIYETLNFEDIISILSFFSLTSCSQEPHVSLMQRLSTRHRSEPGRPPYKYFLSLHINKVTYMRYWLVILFTRRKHSS
jgi:hypothetical protein